MIGEARMTNEKSKLLPSNPGPSVRISGTLSSHWKSHSQPVHVGRSPLGSFMSSDSNNTSPPWSPGSFASGLVDSRQNKRLESYDFLRPEWVQVDYLQSLSSLAQQDLFMLEGSAPAHASFHKLWRLIQVPVLLFAIVIAAAACGWLVDWAVQSLFFVRASLVRDSHSSAESRPYAYAAVCFTLVMLAAWLTQGVYPSAAGGGVAEVKTMLSGAINPSLLAPKLAAVKLVGLVLASTAGLSVGKEGPLIHISCCVADYLMGLPCFRFIKVNSPKRLDIMACACAAGVAATFGSAFGSTLFSIEVTAITYVVGNLANSFMTAVGVALIYYCLNVDKEFSLFADPQYVAAGFAATDLALWVLLGVMCGLFGCLFTSVVSALSRWRNYITRQSVGPKVQYWRRLYIVALFSLLVIPLSFLELLFFERVAELDQSPHALVDYMFLGNARGLDWTLALYVPLKAIAIVFSVTQPLPVGLFSPLFLLGAAFGRLFGECASYLESEHGLIKVAFKPWDFAIVGAAALSGSVTRAVSTAVIVFEMSGESRLRLPLGLAVLVAHLLSSRFTKGVYEELADLGNQPHLPELPPEAALVEVESIMVPAANLPFLALSTTYQQAARLLAFHAPTQCTIIPVVKSAQSMILVGAVLRQDLGMAVQDYEERVSAAEALEAAEAQAVQDAMKKLHERSPSSAGNMVFDPETRTHKHIPGTSSSVNLASHPYTPPPRSPVAVHKEPMAHNKELQHQRFQSTGATNSSNKGKDPRQHSKHRRHSAPELTAAALDASRHGAAHMKFVVVKAGRRVMPVEEADSHHSHLSINGSGSGGLQTMHGGHHHKLHNIHSIPIVMDPSPLQVAHSMELRKVCFMFRHLKLDIAFVCKAGRLVGTVNREAIRKFVGTREPKPMDECMGVFDRPKTTRTLPSDGLIVDDMEAYVVAAEEGLTAEDLNGSTE